MKKAKGKKEYVREIHTPYNEDKKLDVVKESLKGKVSEKDFLNLYRLLKYYDERKEQLEKRNYKLSNENWENELNQETDSPQFYYSTMTVNKRGDIEIWIKRKSFVEIKQLLIKRGMIFGNNPYEKYIVLGDDMETEYTFYIKNES